MKKVLSIPLALSFLLPAISEAHVKWFAYPAKTVRSYSFLDSWVIVWIIISLLLIAIGVYLERKIKVPDLVSKYSQSFTDIAHSVCSIGIGLSLILFSINGYVFAPNIPVFGYLGLSLLMVQAVSGILVLFGFYERVGAALLLLLFFSGIVQNGVLSTLEALDVLGIALYIFIIGRPKWSLIKSNIFESFANSKRSYGVPLLRFFTGLNLVILGFSEKILNPSLTQSFLEHYHWNFMQNIGFFWFSDYWFAFSAGVAEGLIGVFLVLGILTRVTTLALAGFLVTTLVLLGPVELIGHLPHFSMAIVFLVIGSGERLKV